MSFSICAGLLAVFCLPPSAYGFDRTIQHYAHTAWGATDGAPSGIQALAQTEDGFLWLGAPAGLYRFDGVKFEKYQPLAGTLPTGGVRSLLAVPDGGLYIGFKLGEISLLRGGIVTNYGSGEGVPEGSVVSLARDGGGIVWAASSAGLLRLGNGRWEQVGNDWNFRGKLARSVYVDPQGTLWVATESSIVYLSPGSKTFQSTDVPIGQVWGFAQSAHGQLWMAEVTRSVRPVPLETSHQPFPPEIMLGSVGICFDRDGGLWISSLGDGIRYVANPEQLSGSRDKSSNAIEKFTSGDGLTDDVLFSILLDHEGNIWAGTQNGLDQFHKTNFVPVTLPFTSRQDVFAAGDGGDLWLSSNGQMFVIHGSRVSAIHGISAAMHSAYRDQAGVVWWNGSDGIYRLERGHFSRVPYPEGFPRQFSDSSFMTEDSSGVLWIAMQDHGLYSLSDSKWTPFETPRELLKLIPEAAFTDWTGRIWFAYTGGTLLVLNRGEIERVYSKNECPVGSVKAIQGRNQHLWVGGEDGLVYFDGKNFRPVMPDDLDRFKGLSGIAETAHGDLWLAEERGVIHIAADEVQNYLHDFSYRLKYRVFALVDGLPGTFQDAAGWSREVEGTDGRIWFAASKGIAWVDPKNIFKNDVPPPVSILAINSANRKYAAYGDVMLPARTNNLEVTYTALSMVAPGSTRFRYRLEGVDKDWEDAGVRRDAFYTRLGPGKYRFQVIACNNDGVWNEKGAALDFSIAPAWFQTTWFRTLCIAAATLVVWGIYWLRVRQMEKAMAARFDERLAERTRMARELHDTFLQTIQGSKLVADDALENAHDPIRTRRALEQLSEWLARATQEGRAALHSLRSSITETNDLAAGFRRALEDCRREISIETDFSVVGDMREMHPIIRDEVYRIGYEAIRNASTHSAGSRVDVLLSYGNDLSVRVRDNGVGIDPRIAEIGKDGHFGLQGMRERAARIGARLTVVSSANSGTEIKLVVPGRIVFRKLRLTPLDRIKAIIKEAEKN